MNPHADLPVAVIGGGPVGLAAAAHLIARGLPARLYESGAGVAANIREWGHVRLFSPWEFNIDPASTTLLRSHGWQAPPDDVLPTGDDLVAAYLEPLAQTPEMKRVVETNAKVRHVSRFGIDKVASRLVRIATKSSSLTPSWTCTLPTRCAPTVVSQTYWSRPTAL